LLVDAKVPVAGGCQCATTLEGTWPGANVIRAFGG
jgi:hypothetical protein